MAIEDFKVIFRLVRTLKFGFQLGSYLKGHLLALYQMISRKPKNKQISKNFPTFALIISIKNYLAYSLCPACILLNLPQFFVDSRHMCPSFSLPLRRRSRYIFLFFQALASLTTPYLSTFPGPHSAKSPLIKSFSINLFECQDTERYPSHANSWEGILSHCDLIDAASFL